MWAWVIGTICVGLWCWALNKAWGVMVGTGRSIENGKVAQRVREMYVSEAEAMKLMEEAPEDPAYAVKYASLAGENWAELKLRATPVLKRHPHLIFGYAMLARALSELGDKAEAQRITRRGLRRFPRDVELGIHAFHQAVASGQNRAALRIIRRLRVEHADANWIYVTEVDLLIRLNRFAEAEKALNAADENLPGDEVINEAWAKLEAAAAQPG